MKNMNFMNLPKKYSGKDSSYVILPIEYEKDLTGGKGASKASREIIKHSYQLEYYDEFLGMEPFEKGIRLLPSVKTFDSIERSVLKDKDKFIISLGGDHSVIIPILKAFEK